MGELVSFTDSHASGIPPLIWHAAHAREESAIVEVENATAELDSSRRRYLLRVGETLGTPDEAVAQTFGRTLAGGEEKPARVRSGDPGQPAIPLGNTPPR